MARPKEKALMKALGSRRKIADDATVEEETDAKVLSGTFWLRSGSRSS